MSIDARYRTFWRRFWAGTVDWLLFLPVVAIDELVWRSATGLIAGVWLIVSQFAFVAYSIVLHGLFGRTLGKMLLRVKVIDVSEQRPIAFWQALLRDSPVVVFTAAFTLLLLPAVLRGDHPYEAPDWGTAGCVIAAANGLWFFLEFSTMLFSQRRRAAHDLLAKTVVVREGLTRNHPPLESAA